MMSEKKPEPLSRAEPQRKCPVCGHASYSIGGIHPQCHSVKADRKRREIRAAQARSNSPAAETSKKGDFKSTTRLHP